MQRLLIGLIRAYQSTLSPVLGGACRFSPTCSDYAMQAIRQHGAGRGSYLTLRRLLRCHPFCQGGHDPVPAGPANSSGSPMTPPGTTTDAER